MIFRQLLDYTSFTYTYLIASETTKEAILVDTVNTQIDKYKQLLSELGLQLTMVIDTHTHADHITASGLLREEFNCDIAMSTKTQAQCVTKLLNDLETITLGDIKITVLQTPGHTPDCICLQLDDRVLTGDTLFIRGTGRTDFQTGDPVAQYTALKEKLLTLPDSFLVYPGHDYNGMTVSTIGEEKRFNPRLQVNSAEEYATMMNNLNLPAPKLLDVAVPANLRCGLENK